MESFYIYIVIYIIRHVIHIYVAYSRPNGWTDWAGFFVDTHRWPEGVIG